MFCFCLQSISHGCSGCSPHFRSHRHWFCYSCSTASVWSSDPSAQWVLAGSISGLCLLSGHIAAVFGGLVGLAYPAYLSIKALESSTADAAPTAGGGWHFGLVCTCVCVRVLCVPSAGSDYWHQHRRFTLPFSIALPFLITQPFLITLPFFIALFSFNNTTLSVLHFVWCVCDHACPCQSLSFVLQHFLCGASMTLYVYTHIFYKNIYLYMHMCVFKSIYFCMDTHDAEELAKSGCLDRTAELSEVVLIYIHVSAYPYVYTCTLCICKY